MKLFTKALLDKLLLNGRISALAAANGDEADHKPVVKLFMPEGAATWLLSELDADGDRAYGLCDLGMGEPELGYVSLKELQAARSKRLRLRIERDLYFTADKTLSAYAADASAKGRIDA